MPLLRTWNSFANSFLKRFSKKGASQSEDIRKKSITPIKVFEDSDLKLGSKKDLEIIFRERIKGKILPELKHDGSIGHWLESQFGVSANRDDSADWHGFELKTGRSKTTFGDWWADYYLWQTDNYDVTNRDVFLQIFGTKSRADRPDRYSWSGRIFPNVHQYNDYGQKMTVESNLDVTIYYNYSKDTRENKSEIIPISLQHDGVILAKWYRSTLETRVNRKFGQNGWVKFIQSKKVFTEMIIGPPLTFIEWIEYVKTGEIYLDSGMYHDPHKPNNRPYSNWRASNKFWEKLAGD